MTNDEAIRILDPETSHNALVKMMGGRWYQPQAMELLQEAQRMGLQALREKQVGGWISVKDGLPESPADVLVVVYWHVCYQTKDGQPAAQLLSAGIRGRSK